MFKTCLNCRYMNVHSVGIDLIGSHGLPLLENHYRSLFINIALASVYFVTFAVTCIVNGNRGRWCLFCSFLWYSEPFTLLLFWNKSDLGSWGQPHGRDSGLIRRVFRLCNTQRVGKAWIDVVVSIWWLSLSKSVCLILIWRCIYPSQFTFLALLHHRHARASRKLIQRWMLH